GHNDVDGGKCPQPVRLEHLHAESRSGGRHGPRWVPCVRGTTTNARSSRIGKSRRIKPVQIFANCESGINLPVIRSALMEQIDSACVSATGPYTNKPRAW